MSSFDKLQPFFILFAAFLGLLFGRFGYAASTLEQWVVPFLMIMLFFTFLHIPFQEWRSSWKNPKFTSLQLVVNFIWTPALAYGLGSLFLNEHPALLIGFIMLMVTPCTDWYLIFTGLAKGNVPLAASNLPLNLVLQILLLPFYLYIIEGTTVGIEFTLIFETLITLALPLFVALVVRFILTKTRRLAALRLTGSIPILFLAGAIFIMFATHQTVVFENGRWVLLLLAPLLLAFVINFFLAKTISRWCHFSYADRVSFTMITLARNSPLALAIAAVAFPNEPLVFVALLVGPLFELPVLYLSSRILRNVKRSP